MIDFNLKSFDFVIKSIALSPNKKGIIFVFLQDNFNRVLSNGKATERGRIDEVVISAIISIIEPTIENL